MQNHTQPSAPSENSVQAPVGKTLSIPRFFAKAIAIFLILVLGWWYALSNWTTLPATHMAKTVMQTAFDGWVRKAETDTQTHALVVETRLKVPMQFLPDGRPLPAGAVAELTLEAQPAHFGYGLPLFFAMILAGSRRNLLRNLVIGALVLIPFQSFSMVLYLLKEAAFASGPAVAAQMRLDRWQMELIGFGYQLGTLLLPTIVPLILWLWLDKSFATLLLQRTRKT